MSSLRTYVDVVFLPYIIKSPILIVYLLGIIIAVRNLKHKPLASKYALAGFVSMLISQTVGTWVIEWCMTSSFSSSGTSMDPNYYFVIWFLSNILYAIAFSLLIRAIFINERHKISREELKQILEDE